MRGVKRWCVNGHDTYEVGRTGSGHCAECARRKSSAFQAEMRTREDCWTNEMGVAPGLKAWRESLGLTLKELSLECGLTSGKSHKDFKRKVSIEELEHLESGGQARADTRLHIARELWRLERTMREERRVQEVSLYQKGLA